MRSEEDMRRTIRNLRKPSSFDYDSEIAVLLWALGDASLIDAKAERERRTGEKDE